jgi:molybdate transport system ATP-binding protein
MILLNFSLQQGSFSLEIDRQLTSGITALFGPSGAGKTTILDAIAGLRRPSRGTIAIGDRVLFQSMDRVERSSPEGLIKGSPEGLHYKSRHVDLPPHQRHVGYVPQDVALFPHMNVRRNVLFGRREGQRLALETVVTMLEIGELLDRRVPDLSGGERQRVALARALMSAPELLLLDEPLAAVDVERRRRILPYVLRVRDELRIPVIYVSHDRDEIDRIADRVLVVENGRPI